MILIGPITGISDANHSPARDRMRFFWLDGTGRGSRNLSLWKADQMMTQKILCVHNTANELLKLSGTLQRAGYEVVSSDGTEAMKFLSAQDVAGVVLDYAVEAPGGSTLLSRIRHMFPEMPLLLFSDVEEIKKMSLNYFREYLEHPGPPDSLFSRLSKN